MKTFTTNNKDVFLLFFNYGFKYTQSQWETIKHFLTSDRERTICLKYEESGEEEYELKEVEIYGSV
jgi:hypothetical protein